MWSFVEVVRIEQNWGTWSALVTLSKNNAPESFYIKFQSEPTNAQASSAGTDLALKKNLEEASIAGNVVINREDFFARFTNTEITAIYRAAAVNDNLFAYVKLLEMNPIVHLQDPRVINGLQLVESAQLIASGRALEIGGIR